MNNWHCRCIQELLLASFLHRICQSEVYAQKVKIAPSGCSHAVPVTHYTALAEIRLYNSAAQKYAEMHLTGALSLLHRFMLIL